MGETFSHFLFLALVIRQQSAVSFILEFSDLFLTSYLENNLQI